MAPLLGRSGVLRMPQGDRTGFLQTLRQLYRWLRGYIKGDVVDLSDFSLTRCVPKSKTALWGSFVPKGPPDSNRRILPTRIAAPLRASRRGSPLNQARR